MTGRLLSALAVLMTVASPQASAQSAFESSKLSSGVVVQGSGLQSSKLSSGIVIQNDGLQSSKLSAGIVLQNMSFQSPKISIGIVLQTVANGGVVPRAPLTNW